MTHNIKEILPTREMPSELVEEMRLALNTLIRDYNERQKDLEWFNQAKVLAAARDYNERRGESIFGCPIIVDPSKKPGEWELVPQPQGERKERCRENVATNNYTPCGQELPCPTHSPKKAWVVDLTPIRTWDHELTQAEIDEFYTSIQEPKKDAKEEIIEELKLFPGAMSWKQQTWLDSIVAKVKALPLKSDE